MRNISLILTNLLFLLNSHAMEPVATQGDDRSMHIEINLPKAQGIQSGTMVISGNEFSKFNTFFKIINNLPKTQILHDIDEISFNIKVFNNEVALVAMNDSCLAKPHSGIKTISLDTLQDCVGVFIFHNMIGTAAAHVTIGTTLSSLDQFINPFIGQQDVHITLLSSWKTNRLNHVSKHISTKGLSVKSVFVNNVIQQMNADGTVVKRFINPSDFPDCQKLFSSLNTSKSQPALEQLQQRLRNEMSSPVGAVIDTRTGQISFVNTSQQENAPHVSSGIIRETREKMQALPTWMGRRYEKEVKPNEDKMNVNIAFVQYPVG